MSHAASISRTLVFVALPVGSSTAIGEYRGDRFGFEDCNHAMRVAETGAWREDLSAPGLGERCPDYWPTLRAWLDAHGTSR